MKCNSRGSMHCAAQEARQTASLIARHLEDEALRVSRRAGVPVELRFHVTDAHVEVEPELDHPPVQVGVSHVDRNELIVRERERESVVMAARRVTALRDKGTLFRERWAVGAHSPLGPYLPTVCHHLWSRSALLAEQGATRTRP